MLLTAQSEVHDLALKINRIEQEAVQHDLMQQRVKDVEHLIEGAMDVSWRNDGGSLFFPQ